MTKREKLQARYQKELDRMERERLPGAKEELERGAGEKGKWMRSQKEKIERAIRDEDEILFERALGGWLKGWGTVNTEIAENYRKTVEPEMWELRYVRWMNIRFMKLECDMGTFYIVPRTPNRRPKTDHWFTVDEMLDILAAPGVVASSKAFGALPSRPDSTSRPGSDERHLVVNFADSNKPAVYYDYRGRPSDG